MESATGDSERPRPTQSREVLKKCGIQDSKQKAPRTAKAKQLPPAPHLPRSLRIGPLRPDGRMLPFCRTIGSLFGKARQGNKGDQVDADQLSELLRRGGLRAVYHGSAHGATLKEFTRTYRNVVEDATRVMLRLKALFRARGIKAPGKSVYHPKNRAEWLAKLPDPGVRYRAQALYAQLDVLRELRPKVKTAMVAEARHDPAWPVLRSIPFLGPVRVALLLATMRTPWRFRTKRNLWAYSGLAVVTFSSADYTLVDGRPVRRRRRPMTRGLNRNHNRVLKDVFKGAATAATGRPGPLQNFYHGDDRARDARGARARHADP